jgi:glycosyltransferase involved in cell wall biosynthesis
VLFVNENIGGHATVHRHLAATLTAHDHVEAEFVTVPPPGWLRRLDLDLQPLRAQLALSAWVRRHVRPRAREFDAIHLYTHNAGLLATDILREMPSVVTLDTTNAHNAYRLPYRMPTRFTGLTLHATHPFEQRVYRAATRVVANSEWAASSLRADYGVPADKLRVFPFGIEATEFAEPVAPGPPPGGLPTLVFVGRQLERKGGNLLREVHQRALADRCRLVLVTPEAVAPGRNLTVVDDLRPGDVRLWDILRAGSVFVFPSMIDQAPNAVLEAMAAGLPVIAVDTGAVGEMVVDGDNGVLVAGNDAGQLQAAIEQLLDAPATARAMGAAGRRRFDARYRADASTSRLIDVIAEAIEVDRAERRR